MLKAALAESAARVAEKQQTGYYAEIDIFGSETLRSALSSSPDGLRVYEELDPYLKREAVENALRTYNIRSDYPDEVMSVHKRLLLDHFPQLVDTELPDHDRNFVRSRGRE